MKTPKEVAEVILENKRTDAFGTHTDTEPGPHHKLFTGLGFKHTGSRKTKRNGLHGHDEFDTHTYEHPKAEHHIPAREVNWDTGRYKKNKHTAQIISHLKKHLGDQGYAHHSSRLGRSGSAHYFSKRTPTQGNFEQAKHHVELRVYHDHPSSIKHQIIHERDGEKI